MRHMNLRPGLGDSIKQVQANVTRKASTRPHGVKVMQDGEDTTWVADDGRETSVRAVDTAMVELDATLTEARSDLATLNDTTLPELKAALEEQIADIVVTGGGNTTTYSVNEPSADGAAEGDTWYRVVDGKAVGQWQWTSGAWAAVTLTDAVLAGVDVSKLTATGTIPTVVAQQMFTDIFAANKIGADQIAANSITGDKIAANAISADNISGGSFVGEHFTGGEFIGGRFRTSDSEPGQVTLSDSAFQGRPGVEIEPIDATPYSVLPGLGPSANGLLVYGGRSTNGGYSQINAAYNATSLEWQAESATGATGSVSVNSDGSKVLFSKNRNNTEARSEVSTSSLNAFVARFDEGGYRSIFNAHYGGAFMASRNPADEYSQVRLRPDSLVDSVVSAEYAGSMSLSKDSTGILKQTIVGGKKTSEDALTLGANGAEYRRTTYNTSGTVTGNTVVTLSDSGWITTGWVWATGWERYTVNVGTWQPFTYRIHNGKIYYSGLIRRTGANAPIDVKIGTAPANGIPGKTFYNGNLRMDPDGSIIIREAVNSGGVAAIYGEALIG